MRFELMPKTGYVVMAPETDEDRSLLIRLGNADCLQILHSRQRKSGALTLNPIVKSLCRTRRAKEERGKQRGNYYGNGEHGQRSAQEVETSGKTESVENRG